MRVMVAARIARSESFERTEGMQDSCGVCESTVTGPMEVNRKIQQHSNTLTQHKMTYAANCADTLFEPTEKKAPNPWSRYFLWETETEALSKVWVSKKPLLLPKHFPNKRLIHAFRNSRGKIHLEFNSADTAAVILQNWNKDAIGAGISATNPKNTPARCSSYKSSRQKDQR